MVSHVELEFRFNRDSLIYSAAKNKSKSFSWIHVHKNYIEASDLADTLI